MRAYKFLNAGCVGLYSGFRWPIGAGGEPGPWVEAEGELEACGNGIHACRLADLPYWIDDELWEIELAGEVLHGPRGLVARRGRLGARIEAWGSDVAAAFAESCAARARTVAASTAGTERDRLDCYATDADRFARDAGLDTAWAACAAYTEAYLAGVAASGGRARGRAHELAFAAARRAQAEWIAERLGAPASEL